MSFFILRAYASKKTLALMTCNHPKSISLTSSKEIYWQYYGSESDTFKS